MIDYVPQETKLEVGSFLESIYNRPADMTDRNASKLVMHYIERQFVLSSLYNVDYLLESIDFDKVPLHVISAVIRTTSFAKNVLPSWYGALERAKVAFSKYDVDVASLLVGLTDE